MAYEFDIFLSYRRTFPFDQWMHEHFLPFFRAYLTGALNREPKVFIDQTNIHPGSSWPQMLQKALARSRCLVALWTPQYFHSSWCRRECEVMLFREQSLGWRSVEEPRGLIIPVCLFDGEHFPPTASEIQYRAFQRFVRLGEGFKSSERYVELQEAIEALAGEVAEVVRRSPRWRSEWQTKSFLNPEPILERPRRTTILNPGLE